MRLPIILLTLFLVGTLATLSGQPIPASAASEKAHYIFTVYTPTGHREAPVWRTPNVALTTHRLINHVDSVEVKLPPVAQTSLRTYVDLGAAAGAVEVVEEQGSPRIEEVLCYDELLSPEQRQLTESYLAIKYGLTLDQQLPTNYLAQDAAGSIYPVWTATAEPQFRHRILGLARDTAAGLTRLRGASVLAPDLLTLHWPSPPEGTAYLLLADDGAPTARRPARDSSTELHYLARRWRMEVTGTMPVTELRIAPQQLFARAAAGERWVLQLSSTMNDTVISAGDLPDGRLSFSVPSLNPGAYTFQLALTCDECPEPLTPPAEDGFFQSVAVSPNPAPAGAPLQVRIALQQAAGLFVIAYDATGREVVRQHLPIDTHHLTEFTLPAPGAYSLHLRSRLHHRKAPVRTLKVLVH